MKSYLERIQFDKSLWNSFHAKYLTNIRLVILLIISIVVVGIVSFGQIPRRLNPEIEIPIVTVNTLLPGATPEDVEQLVTIPLEEEIESVKDVNTVTSSSRENFSVIVIEFDSSVDATDARDRVQEAVDKVTDLPEDAEIPSVAALDFENEPVWTFSLSSENTASLMRFSKELRDSLESKREIREVQTSGLDEQIVIVTVDPTKMQQYGLSPFQLSQLVSEAANSFPSGVVRVNQSSFSLVIDSQIVTVDDIRNILVKTEGAVVPLNQIASVEERSSLDQRSTLYADRNTQPRQAVQFFVYKSTSANITEAAEAAEEVVNEKLQPYSSHIELRTLNNSAELITEQFDDLIGEFRSTIVLIFLVLLLFLGLRQAVIASFTVPLTFLSSIAIANALGMSLNFLTLFSFLLALGLLIDDTIVVVTAMTRYYNSGKFTPAETAILVWKDFFVPLWSTTATTIWSFVPLLLASGIIGEFIKPIPIIVTTTMLSSTGIAVFITLPLLIVLVRFRAPRRVRILLYVLGAFIGVAALLFVIGAPIFTIPALLVVGLIVLVIVWNNQLYKRQVKRILSHPKIQSSKDKLFDVVENGAVNLEQQSIKYTQLIDRILKKRAYRRGTLLFIIVFALSAYLLVPLGFVQNEFFPKTDEELMYVAVDLPAGTRLTVAQNEARRIANDIRNVDGVQYLTAETGITIGPQFERETLQSSVLLTVNVGKEDERKMTSFEIADAIRERYANYSYGTVAVREASGGPPAGADVQVTFLGPDLNQLTTIADTTIRYLSEKDEITSVDKSIRTGTSKIVFTPDDARLQENNISRSTIGLWLRTYASGFTLDTIRFDEEKNVELRFQTTALEPEELSALSIPSQSGTAVPILALGDFSLSANPNLITREEGNRTITVSASVKQGESISQANQELLSYVENELDLPTGYTWKTGGVNQENQESVNSILQAMLLSFLLITVTMVIEFNSYRQAAIVMLTIPIAISGVFYVFALTGTPLSFPALIGVLALFGIVVTNAIVVVDKINSNLKEGVSFRKAVVEGSGSRLEPIFLTSLTTIFGLLPITLSDPLWRGLGGAIIAGLFFSGLIKLFFVPVLYYSWLGNSTSAKSQVSKP